MDKVAFYEEMILDDILTKEASFDEEAEKTAGALNRFMRNVAKVEQATGLTAKLPRLEAELNKYKGIVPPSKELIDQGYTKSQAQRWKGGDGLNPQTHIKELKRKARGRYIPSLDQGYFRDTRQLLGMYPNEYNTGLSLKTQRASRAFADEWGKNDGKTRPEKSPVHRLSRAIERNKKRIPDTSSAPKLSQQLPTIQQKKPYPNIAGVQFGL